MLGRNRYLQYKDPADQRNANDKASLSVLVRMGMEFDG